MRIAPAAVCVIAFAAASIFVASSEHTITARRASLDELDVHAQDATAALAELQLAQQAYVAAGQGIEAWIPKVEAAAKAAGTALAALRRAAVSADAKSALGDATTAFTAFDQIDRRIRGYVKTGAPLMAADIIFSEGGEAAATAAHGVEKARLLDRAAYNGLEATRRMQEIAVEGSVAALMLLTIIAFARKPGHPSAGAPATAEPAPPEPASAVDDLPLYGNDHAKEKRDAASSTPVEPLTPVLKATAELCTDIGRVSDLEQLGALLERTAHLLDASGLVLWVAGGSGAELQPAMTHGYGPQTVARIPAVPYTADNAAAAAYRTGTLQVVPARPGSSVKGALVAPMILADGCIGVLSAELRSGGETSETILALATILAAQLAAVVAATPAQGTSAARASSI